ncbi:hypothetical protein D3C59_37265 [Streptomyces sp. SHP22-7]|nr:hypothetical protein D3C59_37265 [Streptomyces sp. SHP22-7]
MLQRPLEEVGGFAEGSGLVGGRGQHGGDPGERFRRAAGTSVSPNADSRRRGASAMRSPERGGLVGRRQRGSSGGRYAAQSHE